MSTITYTLDDDLSSAQRDSLYLARLGCALNYNHPTRSLWIDASSNDEAISAARNWFSRHNHRRKCSVYAPELTAVQGGAA